jgi:hypothetical protein
MSEIFKAINAVMNEIGYVQKKKGANLNYSFAGEAALIEAIRPEMVKQGLFLFPTEVRENITTYTTSRGSAMNWAIVVVTYRFAHIGGETFDVQVTGEGADIGDKAFNKAMTGAYKYALRQTFCIETGDDPDKYPPEEYERSPVRGAGVPKPGKQANGNPTDSRGEMAPDEQAKRKHAIAVDTAVMVIGKNDEKPGVITGFGFAEDDSILYVVTVDGKEYRLAPDKFRAVVED